MALNRFTLFNSSGISCSFFFCSLTFTLFSFSEFLLVRVRHTAAAVPGHMSSDWIHHGLEDEGV